MAEHIMTNTTSEVQSAPEHLSMPNIDGFFFEPLYKLMKSSITKIAKLTPCLAHCMWVFSSSMILLVSSTLTFLSSSDSPEPAGTPS